MNYIEECGTGTLITSEHRSITDTNLGNLSIPDRKKEKIKEESKLRAIELDELNKSDQ